MENKNPTREQLFQFLLNNSPSHGETHDRDTINDVLTNLLENYGKPTDILTDDNVFDDLYEACDSEVPIYNAELMDWLKNHLDSIQEYQENIGAAGEILERDGIIRLIMCAYCFTLEQDAVTAYRDLFDAWQEANQ